MFSLLLTAYRKSATPYALVLSPTHYDLPFSHNTSVRDRRRRRRRAERRTDDNHVNSSTIT